MQQLCDLYREVHNYDFCTWYVASMHNVKQQVVAADFVCAIHSALM